MAISVLRKALEAAAAEVVRRTKALAHIAVNDRTGGKGSY